MRESRFMDPPWVYIEIRQNSLKALKGEKGLELPLERAPAGGLTKACREKLTLSLQSFLRRMSGSTDSGPTARSEPEEFPCGV